MDELARRVRHQVFAFYLDRCRPPTIPEIATAAAVTEEQANDALRQLEETHHVVLHKRGVCTPTPISMAHPFSHIPTPFVVSQGNRSWWVNCAWCGFGLAAMLVPSETPATVALRAGSIGQELVFQVTEDGINLEQGQAERDRCVVHYSAPPSSWWIDVKFACGTIHVFAEESEAVAWCHQRGFNFGETMNLDTMWKLAKGSWDIRIRAWAYKRNRLARSTFVAMTGSSPKSNPDPHLSAEAQARATEADPQQDDYRDEDSSFDSTSSLSDTASLVSSILQYRVQNGRTYHAYKAGCYILPNDDVADEHPEAEVIGVNLIPIQPTFVPPNVSFFVDDIEAEWVYTTPNLSPGGYIELMDPIYPVTSDDETVSKGSAVYKWSNLMNEAASKMGSGLDSGLRYKDQLGEAGFVNVVETPYKWPMNTWPRGKEIKELGAWGNVNPVGGI
ncbi:hypothetical protein ACJZ2D_000578 [Fusarium nematophilum]